ncbi:primosomal replication protein PriC [Rodentibacter caecimuris]|uniref:Primosomal replication protein N n=1 Tax=Rodentibacter caecimuris TaxID=1796644 RepID=A0ABX3L2B8_9PAST|nr:hypothetical protein BKG89_03110 [Rodentibacter heylii]
MAIQQLIQTLEQKVQKIYCTLQEKKEQKIIAKFDRTLFSENGQSIDFYLQEIEQTLQKIKSLSEGTVEQYQFLGQKLIAQCKTLSDAIDNQSKHTVYKQNTSFQSQPKVTHPVHRLPPRERLMEYYTYLRLLTEKYEQAEGLCNLSTNNEQKIKYARQAEQLKLRRTKCLDAIELLEEYLAFKEEQENI